VHEDILLAPVWLYEPITLGVIEPLDDTTDHVWDTPPAAEAVRGLDLFSYGCP
jgi:hypothetical protein